MCLGRRFAEFLNQRRNDGLTVFRWNAFAKGLQPLLDTLPDETLLGRYLCRALCKPSQIGDVPLPWLAINTRALNKDRSPMGVALMGIATKFSMLSVP